MTKQQKIEALKTMINNGDTIQYKLIKNNYKNKYEYTYTLCCGNSFICKKVNGIGSSFLRKIASLFEYDYVDGSRIYKVVL